jgi:hypothetical protein
MINYFIPLLAYLAILLGVTMFIAGRKIDRFSWKKFLLLFFFTPFVSMLWLELLSDRGELEKEKAFLLREIYKLKQKIKNLEKSI